MPKGSIALWLRDYNYLCMISNIKKVPYYFRQAERLAERISDNNYIISLSEDALKAIELIWGFSGKWKSDVQRDVDIYFKVLPVLHNAKINF
jgi:hypothetical protein